MELFPSLGVALVLKNSGHAMLDEVILHLSFSNKGNFHWQVGSLIVLWNILLEKNTRDFKGVEGTWKFGVLLLLFCCPASIFLVIFHYLWF